MRQLPTGGALEGGGQQFIKKLGHWLAPCLGFMMERTHQIPRDAGHVVPWSGHWNVEAGHIGRADSTVYDTKGEAVAGFQRGNNVISGPVAHPKIVTIHLWKMSEIHHFIGTKFATCFVTRPR
jgi:hypothetical protein